MTTPTDEQFVRSQRELLGLSRPEMAQALGVEVADVAAWESGERQLRTIERLALAQLVDGPALKWVCSRLRLDEGFDLTTWVISIDDPFGSDEWREDIILDQPDPRPRSLREALLRLSRLP